MNRLQDVLREYEGIVALVVIYAVISLVLFGALSSFLPLSEVTGLGQLCADVLLLPLVIVGFAVTVHEFRKSQERPELRLFWRGEREAQTEGDVILLRPPQQGEVRYRIFFDVENVGLMMTHWFRIKLALPKTLVGDDRHHARSHFGWTINADWIAQTVEEGEEAFNFIVKGNGTFAIYPGEKIQAGEFYLILFPTSVKEYPERNEIHYSLVTEKTEEVTGKFQLMIKSEDFSRPA
jgi:hypothetical protein